VCVCVCVSVSPHANLAVHVITSKTKDTIVLSVEFEAIRKRRFSLTRLVRKLEPFYLPGRGRPFCLDVQFACNVVQFRLSVTVRLRAMLTCYAILWGQRSSV